MKRSILFFLVTLLSLNLLAQSQVKTLNPPIMGWSSWNTYRININEKLIKRQADAIVNQGLKDVGYSYINIDDGFFGWRDKKGVMHPHPTRFPNGIKVIADYIHTLGLKAGIYSDAGSNTCGSIWDKDKNGIGVGLYGHEHQDAILYFKKWGFDFIKIDYCGAGQELNLEEKKRYSQIRKAINDVGCSNVSINICRWAFPGTWAKDIASSWRISADISPQWNSIKYIIDKNLYLSAYAENGHYNDMDMLEMGRGLSKQEEETHFGMWCIMSSPLLIGCNLTTIPRASLELLKNKELIALNQDTLGLQAYVAMRNESGYVLVKDIEQKQGRKRAIALYNPSDSICHFSVPMKDLELDGKVNVRDLIKQKDLSQIENVLYKTVPPHSTVILKLKATERLEPSHYEAEWAYLPCFDDLGKREKSVAYTPMEEASGGMIVRFIGGRKENYIEWKDVYSKHGGSYIMTINFVPNKNRKLEVTVNNGKKIELEEINKRTTETINSISIPIHLKSGTNVVRMGSPYFWTPDLDYFTLKKL